MLHCASLPDVRSGQGRVEEHAFVFEFSQWRRTQVLNTLRFRKKKRSISLLILAANLKVGVDWLLRFPIDICLLREWKEGLERLTINDARSYVCQGVQDLIGIFSRLLQAKL